MKGRSATATTIEPLPGSYAALRGEYEKCADFVGFSDIEYQCNCCGNVYPVKWAFGIDENGVPNAEDPVQDAHCPDCGSDKVEWHE